MSIKRCIPYPFENNLTNTKKALFANLRNQFNRKAPKFFNNLYENWFCTFEFWEDLLNCEGFEKTKAIFFNYQSILQTNNIILTDEQEELLLSIRQIIGSRNQETNLQTKVFSTSDLHGHVSFDSALQATKDFCMERVQKKLCPPFPFESRLSVIKTNLFKTSQKTEYKGNAPIYFDQFVFTD